MKHLTLFFQSVDKLYDHYLEILQELIRTPSPVGDEAEAQRIMLREMRRIGLEVCTMPSSPLAHQRTLVMGKLKGSAERNMILNAHIDTVPEGDSTEWTVPPRSGYCSDGKMFGRGAYDDKSGCVEMLWIAEALKKAGIPLSCNLILQSVVGDEVAGDGTKICLSHIPHAEAAIIIDGTWSNRIVAAHQGAVGFKLTFVGASSSAFSVKRENPLFPAAAFVNNLRHTCKAGGISVHIGKIRGGDWFSSSPATCTLEGLCSFPPSIRLEEVKRMLADTLAAVEDEFPFMRAHHPLLDFLGPGTNAISSKQNWELAKELQDLIAVQFKRRPELHTLAGFSDMRHFLERSIPCCLFGPGQGGNAHAADEYIVIEDMVLVTKMIGAFLISRYAE